MRWADPGSDRTMMPTVCNNIFYHYYCFGHHLRPLYIYYLQPVSTLQYFVFLFILYACTKVDICQWCRDTNSPGRRLGWPKIAVPRHDVQCSRSIRPVVDRPGRRRLSSSHGPENHLGKSSSHLAYLGCTRRAYYDDTILDQPDFLLKLYCTT